MIRTLSVWTQDKKKQRNGVILQDGEGLITDVLDGVYKPRGKKTRKYCMYILVGDLTEQEATECRNNMYRVNLSGFLSGDSLKEAKSLSDDSPFKTSKIMSKSDILVPLPPEYHDVYVGEDD